MQWISAKLYWYYLVQHFQTNCMKNTQRHISKHRRIELKTSSFLRFLNFYWTYVHWKHRATLNNRYFKDMYFFVCLFFSQISDFLQCNSDWTVGVWQSIWLYKTWRFFHQIYDLSSSVVKVKLLREGEGERKYIL